MPRYWPMVQAIARIEGILVALEKLGIYQVLTMYVGTFM